MLRLTDEPRDAERKERKVEVLHVNLPQLSVSYLHSSMLLDYHAAQ